MAAVSSVYQTALIIFQLFGINAAAAETSRCCHQSEANETAGRHGYIRPVLLASIAPWFLDDLKRVRRAELGSVDD